MSPARHLRADVEQALPRRRRSWKQRTLLTMGCVVAALSVAGASLAGYTLVKFASIDRYNDLDTDQAAAGDPKNFLVVGSDVRVDGSAAPGHRSDTIMIVRIDPAEEAAAVLSLPRDLIVPIASTGERGRINSAYAMGDTSEEGAQNLIDTIRQNFQIEIHHYIEIDFGGFARLVDTIGGVPLYFDAAVRDRGSGFYQEQLGCVTLNGERALEFVRARKLEYMSEGEWENDPQSDISRIERQQFFIREAMSRAVGQVTNPVKVTQFVDIATESVNIDGNLGRSEIMDLANRFRDFNPERLQTYPLPVVDNDDGATLSLNEREAEPVLNRFRGLEPGEVSPGLVQVTVLNGTGVQNQATDVADALDRVGFDVVETGDAPPPHPWARTTVQHAPGDEAYAQRLARHVTGGADVTPAEGVEPGVVQLITGSDFTTIHEEPSPTTTTTAPPAAAGEGTTATTAAPTTTTTAAPPTTSTSMVAPVRTPPRSANCG